MTWNSSTPPAATLATSRTREAGVLRNADCTFLSSPFVREKRRKLGERKTRRSGSYISMLRKHGALLEEGNPG
jgi:hypothetical protein